MLRRYLARLCHPERSSRRACPERSRGDPLFRVRRHQPREALFYAPLSSRHSTTTPEHQPC